MNITPALFNKLYETFKRPRLEYSFQAWRPWLTKGQERKKPARRRPEALHQTCEGPSGH